MAGSAQELPDRGYALEVDGRMKAEFATRDGAKAGGEELKRRFPCCRSESTTHRRRPGKRFRLQEFDNNWCASGKCRIGLS